MPSGTLITKSGAEYIYLKEAGEESLPDQLAPIPAFLFAWVSIFILKPALFGVIALSFGIYSLEPFFGSCEVPDILVKIIAILCMCIVAFVNCYSVKLANKVQIVFTVAKLLAIIMIVVGGAIKLGQGNTEYILEGFEDTKQDVSTIALAFYDGLWAYDGWLAYVAARERHLPEVLSYVHIKNYTPLPSVIFTVSSRLFRQFYPPRTLVAIALIIPGNIFSLIDFFSFTAWLFYGATMACVLILRKTRPNDPRPYRVPTIIPIIMLFISVYLVVAPIVSNPRIEFLYATLFILSGMIFYVPFIAYRLQLTFLIDHLLICLFEIKRYIDQGRNPNLYTRDCLEKALAKNELVKGKVDNLKKFKALLMVELNKVFPTEMNMYRAWKGNDRST
nr:hypothetical protein BaRGS_004664 [Batillaria attramentaria]